MTANTVWIQEFGDAYMEPEHAAVESVLCREGKLELKRFTRKRLFRRHIPVGEAVLVVGDHDVMRQAFKQLAKTSKFEPPTNCYPDSLRPLLR